MSFFGNLNPIGGFLGNIITGVDDGVNDVLSGGALSNAQAQKDANAQNVAFAREQMAFQERMSNSAYQRAMTDMDKAGLNPMLAFSQGGASVPSGAMAQVEPVNDSKSGQVSKSLDHFMGLWGASSGIRNQESSTKLNENNADLASVNVDKAAADTRLSNQSTSNKFVEAQRTEQDRKNLKVTERILNERARAAAAEADQSEMERDQQKARQPIDQKAAPADAILERIEDALGTVISGKNVFRKAPPSGQGYYRRQPVR